MRTQKVMTDEMFNTLVNDDKWISEIASPISHTDKSLRHQFYATVTYPIEYIVNDEQIAKAKELKEKRRAEILSSIKKGELVFKAMGGNFNSKYKNGIGNHRVRCYFKNSEGRKFFIELLGFPEDEHRFYIDFSIDEDLKVIREKEFKDAIDYRRKVNGHWFVEEKQDYYAFKMDKTYQRIPYTFDDVIKFVNETYGCNYKVGRKIDWLVSCDEWCCQC